MPIKTGLDFNPTDTTPKIAFLNATLDGNNLLNSCSVISDISGRLQFYAGGGGGELISKYVFLWNRNNEPMHNSYDMTKSKNVWGVYCFPIPGKRDEYYAVFAGIAPHGSSNIYKSIGYSIIDMKGDNGNGSVISSIPEDIYKVKERDDYNVENSLLIKHNNNLDIWLVTKGNYRGLDQFGIVSYLFTNIGINDTIENRFTGFTRDFFKRSNNGKQLVLAETFTEQDTFSFYEYEVSLISLLNFNNKIGIVSMYKYFRACDSCRVLNVEFSPDDSKLYTIELEVYKKASDYIFKGTKLFQYDLTKNTIEEMILTKKQIGKTVPWDTSRNFWGYGSYYDLKVAPDGKIYIIRLWYPYVSAILNPNEKGANVKFIDTAINFVDRYVSFFPTFLNNYYNTHLSIKSDSVFCEGESLVIEAGLSDNTYKSSYSWKGPKGEIYNTAKISIPNCDSSHSGNYQLTVDVNGAKLHDSIRIKILPNPPPEIQGSREVFWKTTKNYSTTENKDISYYWVVKGGVILTPSNLGKITVKWDTLGIGKVNLTQTNTKTGCVSSSQMEVIVRGFPQAEITGDTTACEGDTVLFKTFSNENLSYFWLVKGLRAIGAQNEANITLVFDSAGYGNIRLIRYNKLTDDTDTADFELLIFQRPAKPEIKLKADTTLETVPGFRYKWYKDSVLISDNDDNKLKIQSSGRFSVKIIDQNGCESELSDYIDIILSVRENDKKLGLIEISPNPAGEYIEITGFSHTLNGVVAEDVRIFDVLGECVMTIGEAGGTHPLIPSQEGNIRVDVSGLPAGVYFVRCGEKVIKFIKL